MFLSIIIDIMKCDTRDHFNGTFVCHLKKLT